jgi:hypothetical protein
MNRMTDETMALTVAEATMQDFLAAVLLAERDCSPALARVQPSRPLIEYPVARQTARARMQSPGRHSRPVPVARDAATDNVAGARTIYWLGLAVAVAFITFL